MSKIIELKTERTPYEKRVSESVIYEAYFDLWGLPVAWVTAISDKLSEVYQSGDTAEAYLCEAAAGFRFQSESKERVEEAKRVFKRMLNLCAHTYREDRCYYLQCG